MLLPITVNDALLLKPREEATRSSRSTALQLAAKVCVAPVLAITMLFVIFVGVNSSMENAPGPDPRSHWALYPLDAASSEQDLVAWIFHYIKAPREPQYAQIGRASQLQLAAPWRGISLERQELGSDLDYSALESGARFDYVSVNLQSDECLVFHRLACSASIRPRVVNVAFNSNFPLQSTLANLGRDSAGNAYTAEGDAAAGRMHGCGLGALHLIAAECEYSLVNAANGNAAYFVANEDLNSVAKLPLEHWSFATNVPSGSATMPRERRNLNVARFLCDFKIWMQNAGGGNEDACRGQAALRQVQELGLTL